MRTEYEIYMDYKNAINQAKRLRGIASKMNGLANGDMVSTMNSVRSNWSGENAEAYLVKGDRVREKISGTAGDLERVASAIEEIAERTMQAELRALRIASD